MIVIANNNMVLVHSEETKIVGFFVDSVVCFKHWDKRRNPYNYQPAFKEDLKNYPCTKCEDEKAYRLKMAKLGH